MNTSSITSIIFDFGGVLFSTEPYSGNPTTTEERKSISAAIKKIAETHIGEIKRGIFTVDNFHNEFILRTQDVTPSRQNIVLRSICEPDPRVLNIIAQLHSTFAIYGLVNAPYGWTEIRRSVNQLDRYFNRIVVSHEIDVRKPDEKIYRHFLQATNTQPEQCIFIDDKEAYCTAAKKIGFRVIQYQQSSDLRQLLPQ